MCYSGLGLCGMTWCVTVQYSWLTVICDCTVWYGVFRCCGTATRGIAPYQYIVPYNGKARSVAVAVRHGAIQVSVQCGTAPVIVTCQNMQNLSSIFEPSAEGVVSSSGGPCGPCAWEPTGDLNHRAQP